MFKYGMAIGACLAIVYWGWQERGLAIEQQQQQDLYCEMVGIYKETKGEYGWPDYKHIAERVCQ